MGSCAHIYRLLWVSCQANGHFTVDVPQPEHDDVA